MLVEGVRDELRSQATLSLTDTEREQRERMVEMWEREEIGPQEVRQLFVALNVQDWPETWLTRFIWDITLRGVSWGDAMKKLTDDQVDELARLLNPEGGA